MKIILLLTIKCYRRRKLSRENNNVPESLQETLGQDEVANDQFLKFSKETSEDNSLSDDLWTYMVKTIIIIIIKLGHQYYCCYYIEWFTNQVCPAFPFNNYLFEFLFLAFLRKFQRECLVNLPVNNERKKC